MGAFVKNANLKLIVKCSSFQIIQESIALLKSCFEGTILNLEILLFSTNLEINKSGDCLKATSEKSIFNKFRPIYKYVKIFFFFKSMIKWIVFIFWINNNGLLKMIPKYTGNAQRMQQSFIQNYINLEIPQRKKRNSHSMQPTNQTWFQTQPLKDKILAPQENPQPHQKYEGFSPSKWSTQHNEDTLTADNII